MEGQGNKATAQGMELLRKEVEKLKEEVKTSEKGEYLCIFSHANCLQLLQTRLQHLLVLFFFSAFP